MKRILSVVTIAAVALMSFTVISGYKPGDTVTPFSLKNVDNRMIGLNDYRNAKGLIIIFTCNHCPFAKLYQERMNELNAQCSKVGFPLIAISSNDAIAVPEDSFEEMAKRAKERHYNFPYLYDHSQSVARAFGAAKTPQAFVLLNDHGKWIVKYSGAIDDNGAHPEKVTKRYAAQAVEALVAGNPLPVETTKSVGCAIKWKPY